MTLKFWRFLTTNLWPILSGAASLYFLWAVHQHVGFPPIKPLTPTAALYLGLFVLFMLAPFVHRFRLGRLIEFETKVEEVRSDMKEVRTETRELISTVSAVATAVSTSASQSVVVNFPSSEWAQAAREEMSTAFGDDADPAGQDDDIREYTDLTASDPNYALARLRMDIERQLRRILNKRQSTEDPLRMHGKLLTARSLFRMLVSQKPKYQEMRSSFDYVLEVCNAAIHGQRISDGIAKEAVGMGLRILREFKGENESKT